MNNLFAWSIIERDWGQARTHKLYYVIKIEKNREYIKEVNDVSLIEEILSMFVSNKKKAIENYIEFMDIEDIKGKYFKGKKLELRNKFIKEVLKYKAINQVKLVEFLSISSHVVLKAMNKLCVLA